MWKKVQGNQKPQELLILEDENCVYIRRNIHKVEIEGDQLFEYEENCLSLDDWKTYQDIFINQTDITDLQLALVEVYEKIGG